jgi:hypothetical protein
MRECGFRRWPLTCQVGMSFIRIQNALTLKQSNSQVEARTIYELSKSRLAGFS